jgi:hypothetical protein
VQWCNGWPLTGRVVSVFSRGRDFSLRHHSIQIDVETANSISIGGGSLS